MLFNFIQTQLHTNTLDNEYQNIHKLLERQTQQLNEIRKQTSQTWNEIKDSIMFDLIQLQINSLQNILKYS